MATATMLTSSIVSDHSRRRLESVIVHARHRGNASPDLLHFLQEKLDSAECVSASEVPDDVLTMNSKFSLRDLATKKLKTFVLRYPDDAPCPRDP